MVRQGAHTHPKCVCHETIGRAEVDLSLLLEKERLTVRRGSRSWVRVEARVGVGLLVGLAIHHNRASPPTLDRKPSPNVNPNPNPNPR